MIFAHSGQHYAIQNVFGGVAKLIASGLSPVPSLSAVIYGRTKLS